MFLSDFRVLVIGAQDFHIQCLEELGIDYTLFQVREEVTEYQQKIANELLITDYKNVDSVISLAKSFHNLRQYNAVIGYKELALKPCAIIAKSLGIPSNCDEHAVEFSRDKLKMRGLLKGTELDNVAFERVNSVEQIKNFLAQHKNAILKPYDGAGSIGVTKISTDNVDEALGYSQAAEDCDLLIEEFIEGNEFSVESISLSGQHQILAITEKLTTGAPHFVEIGHHQPAQLDEKIQQKIESKVCLLLDLLGHKTGPCHTEVKVNNSQVHIIETHTRNGGDNIWELTHITTGINVFERTVTHLLGIEQPSRNSLHHAAAVRYVMPKVSRVSNILHLEDAINLPNVIRVNLSVKVGDKIAEMNSSLARCGYVITSGNTVAEAVESAEQARNTVIFE
ncbi:ATP-grasp domain-containing protein [Aestuariibacter sp. AA17]|uniref:ATP-grasp domain-containing protein n=1 Tax=Fluctibacter corallii TaxID=2984329 RepID=A0ABT3A6X6_9ALTE|nr:ATP-grasp domain-containing protein [Aestuariibacter sp. AA17]MCV2884448.1 ATP-grasp domain-containing protein [Aestuariibacter sp. AA17]